MEARVCVWAGYICRHLSSLTRTHTHTRTVLPFAAEHWLNSNQLREGENWSRPHKFGHGKVMHLLEPRKPLVREGGRERERERHSQWSINKVLRTLSAISSAYGRSNVTLHKIHSTHSHCVALSCHLPLLVVLLLLLSASGFCIELLLTAPLDT